MPIDEHIGQDAPNFARPEVDRAPVFAILAQEAYRVICEEPRDMTPDQTPDLRRELIMMDGATQGLERRAAELVARLTPILTEPDEVLRRVEQAKSDPTMSPRSELARQTRDISARIGAVEMLLSVVAGRLGV